MTDAPKQKKIPTKEQKQAADPQRSVWVAASAGSGKTQVLVDRVLRLLLDGADPQAILCLTFTKAAAAEMANRLFERLSDWIALSDKELDEDLRNLGVLVLTADIRASARKLFARALETPGGLKIQTIHAFCERLLQLFPVESGMAPGFRVLEEHESKKLFRDALMQSLSSDDEATQSAWAFLDDGSVTTLEQLEALAKPFLSGSTGMRQRLSDMEVLAQTEKAVQKILQHMHPRPRDEIVAEICAIDVHTLERVLNVLSDFEKNKSWKVFAALRQALDATTHAVRLKCLAKFCLTDGKKRKEIIKEDANEAEPDAAAKLAEERTRLESLFEELANQETLDANITIYRAMAGVLARVNVAKRSRGLYDFDDLIARAAQLLNSHEAAQWVLYKLDKGLTHILVDEAQDTSPAQWTIIKALAGEFFTSATDEAGRKRTIFAVGDIKQSIYSFQGADIAAFEAARKFFDTSLKGLQDKLDEVDLSISYRSTQQVLDVVDHVFAEGQFARSGFGPREVKPHTAKDEKRIGLVELWDIVRPNEKTEHDSWKAPVDALSRSHPRLILAERIARTIKSWIGKRVISGRIETVTAGDILILLQSRNVLFNALIGALRRHGVPVAGADRLKLQESLIVQDLLMLGQFMRLPQDDNALACILKSPLVPEPLTEEQLFSLAYDRGTETLWQRLSLDSANHEMLSKALNTSDTPYIFFASLLQTSKRSILERLGQEADDAGQEFLTLALDYEQKYGTSFTGFLDWLSEDETEIKREMEAGSGLVRLMTVHGSKGLEAPIVILADAADPLPTNKSKLVQVTREGPTRGLQIFQPTTLMKPPAIAALKELNSDLAKAERMRLLYVGMTRAADELYICGSVNKFEKDKVPLESWYPQVSAVFEGRTGLQGVRQITDDPELTIWRFGAEPVKQTATEPSQVEETPIPKWATEKFPDPETRYSPLLASRDSDSFDKQAVKRGTNIHRLLELMADAPPEKRIELGQIWAARRELPHALVEQFVEVLGRADLQPFFGPNGQSEVAINGQVPGLGAVTGRVDRLAIAADVIYILDYKTNRNPLKTLRPDHDYVKQMAGYVAVLQQAYPNHDVKPALLWTQTADVMWLESDLISRALDRMVKETA